jgi:flavin reductase (DIM6/NTAB) family NADH-FMN oxidoreductase RutF
MKKLALSKVYQFLEPGPVVLLATAHKGASNAMTMSWHMMVDFEPPLIACIVSNRDHSFKALRATKECVIAIPPVELAEKIVAIGNCSGRDVDKFAAFGLTPRKGALVSAPLIAECFVNIECRVIDTRLVNRYGLFILQGVEAWFDPARSGAKTLHHKGFGRFIVDGETIELKSNMP